MLFERRIYSRSIAPLTFRRVAGRRSLETNPGPFWPLGPFTFGLFSVTNRRTRTARFQHKTPNHTLYGEVENPLAYIWALAAGVVKFT